jgi:hypothetical protein
MDGLPQQITYPHQTISREWIPNYHSLCWGSVLVCIVVYHAEKLTTYSFFKTAKKCDVNLCHNFILLSDESLCLQTSFAGLNRHAKAQVFSHWVLTTETWGQLWGSPCGIFGGQNRNGASFSLPLTVTPQLHTH